MLGALWPLDMQVKGEAEIETKEGPQPLNKEPEQDKQDLTPFPSPLHPSSLCSISPVGL